MFNCTGKPQKNKMPSHCVIGSGPAGAACATALLARGARVLMLDAGIELEPERARLVRELAGKKFTEWEPAQIEAARGNLKANIKGIPLKKFFGSDFPYRETEEKIPWRARGVGLCPSLALGGLSNVWGASMLPARQGDISDWPVPNCHLAPHYRAVARMTGLAARHDDLEELFPLHCDNPAPLSAGPQAALLLKNLQRHRLRLRKAGWHFGASRLAVRSVDSPLGCGCVYCGRCMTGCPYGCIYNSADTVRQLLLQPQEAFRYQPDVIVTHLREKGGAVVIEAFHRQTRRPLLFEAERVYLAVGVIPTAQILLRSQNAYDRALVLRDSQYFLFPILQGRRVRGVGQEAMHTLSQVFLELDAPPISRRSVHLQIYTYSDILGQAVRQSVGPFQLLARPLEERLLIVQGYLHSDESSAIEMRLKRDGDKEVLELEPKINPRTPRVIRKILRALLGQFRALGGIVAAPLLQLAEPGRGFHSGGSIPMRAQPGEYESDCLGRPSGWSRLHIVDASVLPTIPATTITFPVMANAHRIGWETAGGIAK